MLNQFSRTQLLVGADGMEKLFSSRVAVFGIGGVGGYTVEALARSGIGALDLIDDDKICLTNINRQIIATRMTVGRYKADVMKERVLEINPLCDVRTIKEKITPENVAACFEDRPDFVADAIDDVPAKIALILYCRENEIPLISAMGTGNKLHPELLQVADISKTEVCPLCRSVRKKLRDRGVKQGVSVVYSKEIPIRSPLKEEGRPVPASSAFVPSSAGLLMTSYIIDEFQKQREIEI